MAEVRGYSVTLCAAYVAPESVGLTTKPLEVHAYLEGHTRAIAGINKGRGLVAHPFTYSKG